MSKPDTRHLASHRLSSLALVELLKTGLSEECNSKSWMFHNVFISNSRFKSFCCCCCAFCFSQVFLRLGYRSCFPGLFPDSLVTLFSPCVLPLCLGAGTPTAPRELRCPPLLHLFIDTGRPHSKCFASNPSLQMTREVHPGRTVDCNALPSKQGSEW